MTRSALFAPPPRSSCPAARPAVFVDKDGTLVENLPFNVDPERLRFMSGALAALAAFHAQGYELVVVTNQAGLARGLFTHRQFEQLESVLRDRLRAEAGVELREVMVCPHESGRFGLPQCACRKPAPGMLLRAARRLQLDLVRSWMVGDTLDDVEAGRRAGCRAVLLDSGGETEWRRSPLRQPDARCADWAAVRRLIEAAG